MASFFGILKISIQVGFTVLKCVEIAFLEHVSVANVLVAGAFGLPRPWYFPLQKSYWLGYDLTEEPPSSPKNRSNHNGSRFLQYLRSAFSSKSTLNLAGIEQDQPSTENFRSSCNQLYEPEQEDLVLGVSVGGLSKRYKGSRKYALKDLTLNLFEGQITALLGHNGAGKTTTM